MRNVVLVLFVLVTSCDVGDVSKDLGKRYKLVEESPKCIYFESEEGRRKILIPPDIVEYRNTENYIIARTDREIDGGGMEWWIVDKNTREIKSFTNREDFRKYLRDNEIPIFL